MFILYPQDYFNKRNPDESFADETQETKLLMNIGTFFSNNYLSNDKVLYRGWMLSSEEYDEIYEFCNKNKLELITSKKDYYMAHHMNNWYEKVKDITPETMFFSSKLELISNINNLKWDAYFIKDSVKSLTTKRGSIAKNIEDVIDIISEIEEKKGIEGLLALRKVHNFITDTEVRYFSIHGELQKPEGKNSLLAKEVANRFKDLPFISIDIIEDQNKKEWLVEIGDGQVSDMKMWDPKDFAKMLAKI